MNEQYIKILEAEVEALRTRLNHVMRWVYRDYYIRSQISPETVDLLIKKYIEDYESEKH